MEELVIEGGRRLQGAVQVSGAKNAILPILAGCLLARGKSVIRNVPNLKDVRVMGEMLRELGVKVRWQGEHRMEVEVVQDDRIEAPYEWVRQMRASFWVLGALLARRGQASVPLPGGCVIGVRPVDLHLKGLRAMGAEIEVRGGNVIARAPQGLHGAEIYLGGHFGSSVGATVNVLLAAVLARGRTVIHSAACEPEVDDLANFLHLMGAQIRGIGSPRLEIEGVEDLHGVDYFVIPDRIEAATLLIAGAITRGDVKVVDARPEHLFAILDTFREIGVPLEAGDRWVSVHCGEMVRFHSVDITTHPYPGFPTDAQAQMMALLTTVEGISVITEYIFPDRFMHVAEMNRLGAGIRKENAHAIVEGQRRLSGATVMASDLRASAAMVLAGLVAEGRTRIQNIEHLDRGYERLEEKLRALGAHIEREKVGVESARISA
ncbi:MAG: UDP-N-acetylglucosamine 1-carboxyvinyltransferase [Planctomycetes bacterium]|nr:UDP-N-acetylglucosamine 1-carboxyvinyltransferase [Planctomycetota bacterium]